MDEFAMILLGFLAVILVILLVAYLLNAISIYKLMAANDMEGKWMAFIPILNNYMLGSIFQDYTDGKVNAFIFVLIPILSSSLTSLSSTFVDYQIFTAIICIVAIVLSFYIVYAYFKAGEVFDFAGPALILSLLGLSFINNFVFASRTRKMREHMANENYNPTGDITNEYVNEVELDLEKED